VVPNCESEIKNGVKIIGVNSVVKSRGTRILKTVLNVFSVVRKIKADIYHFHDPELIWVGILLVLSGNKVVYDVHEDLPADIMDKEWIGNKFLRLIISKFASLVEKTGAFFFHGIATVTTDIAANFPESKTILLQNLPVLKLIDEIEVSQIEHKKKIIIYSGGLTKIRGLKELYQAMNFVDNSAELWILGKWSSLEFENECNEVLLDKNRVVYKGIVSQEDVFAITKLASIGVVPFLPVPNHIAAMPNKPFEYISCKVPIVMSDFPKWKSMFGSCALFVNSENPVDIAEKINVLLSNETSSKQLGENGREMVENRFCWESEKKNLNELYTKILKK